MRTIPRMDDPVDLLAQLVEINSVNPGLVPGAPGEREAVEILGARLARSGFETVIVEAPGHPNRPSLLAWTPGAATDGPTVTVLLNGHLDTVGVDDLPEPFTPHITGDRMTGRGTCDMKGGCAALVVAAERIARRQQAAPHDPTPQLVLALVADEEDASLGTLAVLDALATRDLSPDVCLVAEPTGLDLARSHRGYAVVEVDLEGHAAHSSQPAQGVNAVTHLGRLLVAVDAAAGQIEDTGGSLMATVAHGGTAPFSIPARAHAVIERRTVPGQRAAEAHAEVDAILERLRADDTSLRATTRLTHAREAWQLATTGPSADFASALGAALQHHGHQPGDFHAPYWMESALFEAAGIPTVVCGPAGGGLHSVDEWVSLTQVRTFTNALEAALLHVAVSRSATHRQTHEARHGD